MKKVRLVKLIDCDSDKWPGLSSLGTHLPYTTPLITYAIYKGNSFTISGNHPLSKYLHVDKIPQNFQVQRHDREINSGAFFRDNGSISFRIYSNDFRRVRAAFMHAVLDVVKAYGITAYQSTHRPDSNDLVFEQDGKVKKFCGMSKAPRLFTGTVTLKFNAEKVAGIYKLDTGKFQRRGIIRNITEVVGGLTEANPAIDRDIADQIVARLADILNWNVQDDELNATENEIIDRVAEKSAGNVWKFDAVKI